MLDLSMVTLFEEITGLSLLITLQIMIAVIISPLHYYYLFIKIVLLLFHQIIISPRN